jgi:uncharacterized DUF497 family protein
MRDADFEWDDRKSAVNVAQHGVTFTMARSVFDDPNAISQIDDRYDYGEDRFTVIGMVESHLLFVAYTLRGDRIRIITARGAEPHERRQYHEKKHERD